MNKKQQLVLKIKNRPEENIKKKMFLSKIQHILRVEIQCKILTHSDSVQFPQLINSE